MTNRPTLASKWKMFIDVAPGPLSAAERLQMQIVFYSGAKMLFDLIAGVTDGANDEPTEEELASIEALSKELDDFCEAMRKQGEHYRERYRKRQN